MRKVKTSPKPPFNSRLLASLRSMNDCEFDLQPHLIGNSILLRPLQADDAEWLYQVASDPLIWQQHPSPLRYQRKVFDSQIFQSGILSKSTLVAVELGTSSIIGSSRYYDLDANNREIAIGLTFLARSYWGGRVNGEMKDLMLKHALNWAKRVWFHVGINNIRSRKAMEKIGAKLSHIAPRLVNEVFVDHCFYYID